MNNIPQLETKFSRNWNNKLGCQFFTTIRLLNPAKYRVGSVHWIRLNDVTLGRAKVVIHEATDSTKITDRVALVDAGMPAKDLHAMMCRMYKRPEEAILSLSLVTFEYVERIEKKDAPKQAIAFQPGNRFAFVGANAPQEVFTFVDVEVLGKTRMTITCENFKGEQRKYNVTGFDKMVKL